jgi:hypothetical protein
LIAERLNDHQKHCSEAAVSETGAVAGPCAMIGTWLAWCASQLV